MFVERHFLRIAESLVHLRRLPAMVHDLTPPWLLQASPVSSRMLEPWLLGSRAAVS